MITPESLARQQIDAMLIAAGWVIQDYKALNLSAGQGIALREVPLTGGRCDYLLLVDRIPVGVVEAKKQGTTLSTVADQSGFYAENLPGFLAKLTSGSLRFLYESTGVETLFRDERDPYPRSRPVFAFHRPATLAEWLAQPDTLRARLAQMPFAHPLSKPGCAAARSRRSPSRSNPSPRPSRQDTFAACAATYRQIKHAGARRVLVYWTRRTEWIVIVPVQECRPGRAREALFTQTFVRTFEMAHAIRRHGRSEGAKLCQFSSFKMMLLSSAKIRLSPDGLHYFNRNSGLNVLVDDVCLPIESWHIGPRQTSIALTNTCDLDCTYCYAPKFHAILNYDSVCGWISEIDQHGGLGIGFGGGEPTLHPRFADLCEFATDQTRLAVTFTTHGHHLRLKLLSRLDGNVNFIRLSMDGVGPTYERLRGRAFSNFAARVRDVGSIAPFGINFVVNADTIGELDAAVAFAHVHGAREFLLLPEQPTGGRPGISPWEIDQLHEWVSSYRGDVRLAVSEAGAERLGVCDPCGSETGFRAYVHISAAGMLQGSSFAAVGVPITQAGVIAALQQLQQT